MSIEFFLLLCAAYLIGSISFAVVLSKLGKLPDPRSFGSGNPGASNTLTRFMRKHGLYSNQPAIPGQHSPQEKVRWSASNSPFA